MEKKKKREGVESMTVVSNDAMSKGEFPKIYLLSTGTDELDHSFSTGKSNPLTDRTTDSNKFGLH
jgi:hypothetical protein